MGLNHHQFALIISVYVPFFLRRALEFPSPEPRLDQHPLDRLPYLDEALQQSVAWCITRPGLWFSIEPIENINQFQRVVANIWARFLPDNQYYQYVIQARLQGRYEDVTEWPKLGTETYLKQLNNKDIHRCIILAKGSYQECQDKLGCALVRTLKDNSRLSVHNTTFMSEYFEPFRVRLSDVNKKRLIASEFEETNAAKRSRKFY